MCKKIITARLEALRNAMAEKGVAATIIPQTDPHQGEYLSDHWKVREYYSGFNGSAGDLVVTADAALLWTDSRYFIQAAQQLEGTGIKLMKDGLEGVPSIASWLAVTLPKGATVGIDGMLFSASAIDGLQTVLDGAGIKLNTSFDPATVWEGRPELPADKVFVHDIRYAGKSADEKTGAVLADAYERGADGVFVSALDEIAWLLNLRSSDVECNPVLTAFLYLAKDRKVLFVNPAKIDSEVGVYLAAAGVETAPYESVMDFLKNLPGDCKVLVQPERNAVSIVSSLGERALCGTPATAILKACKNDVQIAGIRAAMQRDGAALVRAFMEIESKIDKGLTELDVCEILRRQRAKSEMFFDESFGTIAGYGPNGAIVHYSATEESNTAVRTGNLLLIDSGAQYLDGTTDITRTISIGEPTEQQRRDFTLVMKGHIALARAIFPAGTTGHQLDVLARQFLWQNGLSYLHGTGHGVGHFLNVHEGPQSVRLNYVPTPLMPGMLTSNEPGLYRENLHGIRCENLVLTVPAMTTEFGRFLKFETVTMFPFDRNLFDKSIMTAEEVEWVNNYHAQVREILMGALDTDAERKWLTDNTEKI